jgi:hypothetical protein
MKRKIVGIIYKFRINCKRSRIEAYVFDLYPYKASGE